MSRYIVGVTGGIGSGKSAICNAFVKFGIDIVDADIVAREVVVPGSDGLLEITENFGPQVIDSNGQLDRKKLRGIIFEDDSKRQLLESILHPRIRRRVESQLAAATSDYCLLCVPLMIERGNSYHVDRLLVVDCPEDTQISRVMARDNLTREQVLAIMATQATRQQRLEKADDVIMNDGSIEELEKRVASLHRDYLQRSAQV